ncbi:anhydro-N-acetylmuramic acid kinase [Legionella rowbothamii]|uniref:anhydro-N-acetylmuramic acid kinase n=1 Tax=Legionella rowbothamii TaxID=96229 RepID=UPI0010559A5B|nr:anhydro-N-acetylmuramic acid kinase [Legionella rowbothamii]
MTLFIGLMSGTSMDGIDAAIVDIPSNKLICGITKKYSDEVILGLNKLLDGSDLSLALICQLNTLVGRDFAHAVKEVLHEAALSAKDICAIGSHGQTVCHNTESSIPYTLQLGCGHTLSSLTGITVIADFRTRDLVNGGQGAPFAPLYHQELFSKQFSHVALVNIGGIANITFINAGHATRGWDVGPGNCLMDAWITKHQGKSFDANGTWAQQGMVIQPLLDTLLADPFIQLTAPKSIGKEYFSLAWLESHLKQAYKAADVQKTLLAFTAHPIADAMTDMHKEVKELFLCGGGTHNLALKQMIQDLLPKVVVKSVAEVGVSPDYLEAMLFAWLAAQTVNQQPVDLGAITGSQKPAILGAIYPSS